MYLMLAYPEGRLRRDWTAGSTAASSCWSRCCSSARRCSSRPIREHTPWATCDADCPPQRVPRARLRARLHDRRRAAASASCSRVARADGDRRRRWRSRWREATPPRRRTDRPGAGRRSLASIGILAAFFVARRADPDGGGGRRRSASLWSLCLPGDRRGVLRPACCGAGSPSGDVLGRLTAALGDDVDAGRLRAALAGALDDPTLEVVYPDRRTGRLARMAAEVRGATAVTPMIDDERAGRRARPRPRAVASDEELLEAVGSTGARRAQLQHTERPRLAPQLEDSRKRIARPPTSSARASSATSTTARSSA